MVPSKRHVPLVGGRLVPAARGTSTGLVGGLVSAAGAGKVRVNSRSRALTELGPSWDCCSAQEFPFSNSGAGFRSSSVVPSNLSPLWVRRVRHGDFLGGYASAVLADRMSVAVPFDCPFRPSSSTATCLDAGGLFADGACLCGGVTRRFG